MRSVRRLIWMVLCLFVVQTGRAAMTVSEIRNNARFMTDRMAHELSLSSMQRNDVYEINYDFFYGVRDIMDDLAYGYTYAIDQYYNSLDLRNEDLSYVLTRRQFERFMNKDYFYRPIYVENKHCTIRLYLEYDNPSFYYFAAPLNFLTYVGIHSRVHYVNGYYCNRYHHARYAGPWTRPSRHVHYVTYRHHDFGPGIAGRPTRPPYVSRPNQPVAPPHRPGVVVRPPSRPNHPVARPEHRPSRPDYKPSVRPERPSAGRPSHPSVKPDNKPSRPNHRPSVKPSHENRPSNVRPSRPSVKPDKKPSRPSHRPSDDKKENQNRRNIFKV